MPESMWRERKKMERKRNASKNAVAHRGFEHKIFEQFFSGTFGVSHRPVLMLIH
jgi:DNA invertase Pin-like site-specific DNA recombinase